mgnify:CR=1 FL=1
MSTLDGKAGILELEMDDPLHPRYTLWLLEDVAKSLTQMLDDAQWRQKQPPATFMPTVCLAELQHDVEKLLAAVNQALTKGPGQEMQ